MRAKLPQKNAKTARAKLTLLYLATLQVFRRGELSLEEDQILLRLRSFLDLPADHVSQIADLAFNRASKDPAPQAKPLSVGVLMRIARRQAKIGGPHAATWRRELPALDRCLRSPQPLLGSFFTDLNQVSGLEAAVLADLDAKQAAAAAFPPRRRLAPSVAVAFSLFLALFCWVGAGSSGSAEGRSAARKFETRMAAAVASRAADDLDAALGQFERAELAAWGLGEGREQAQALHKARYERTMTLIRKAHQGGDDLHSEILTGFEDAIQALGDSDRFWKQRTWTKKQRASWFSKSSSTPQA